MVSRVIFPKILTKVIGATMISNSVMKYETDKGGKPDHENAFGGTMGCFQGGTGLRGGLAHGGQTRWWSNPSR
jgi:hypothetical protein